MRFAHPANILTLRAFHFVKLDNPNVIAQSHDIGKFWQLHFSCELPIVTLTGCVGWHPLGHDRTPCAGTFSPVSRKAVSSPPGSGWSTSGLQRRNPSYFQNNRARSAQRVGRSLPAASAGGFILPEKLSCREIDEVKPGTSWTRHRLIFIGVRAQGTDPMLYLQAGFRTDKDQVHTPSL